MSKQPLVLSTLYKYRHEYFRRTACLELFCSFCTLYIGAIFHTYEKYFHPSTEASFASPIFFITSLDFICRAWDDYWEAPIRLFKDRQR